jgi:hypothetical protein
MPKNPPDDPEQLDTLRYHAIGNAVTVNVAKWLAQRIGRYLDAGRVLYEAAKQTDVDVNAVTV